ncbi:MAG: AMP-binding protein [Thermoguttaceae bacterium]
MTNPSLLAPIRQMMRSCRKGKNEWKLADSTGVKMTPGRVFAATIIFRRLIRKILGSHEQNVGVLMPTSVYGILANLALALDRRTTVNLNYTFHRDTINYCIKKAEVEHVVTSRRVLDRFPDLKLDAKFIVMEELGKKMSILDKIIGLVDGYITPVRLLEWVLRVDQIKPDDILTIIFTSGSTGTPKGAMLTQNCIAENVDAFIKHLNLQDSDILLGSLPLFHSFGYTTTLWLPTTSQVKCAYHFNPLEPKKIGEMAKEYKCTAMPSTPTFCRGYLRRPKEEFDKMPTIICGAEKLPVDLIDSWEAKFGFRPAEGYGTTELSPVVATNVPKGRRPDYQDWLREGTIGRPLANLEVRVTDPETGAVLPSNTPGMFEVKGPSVMSGYYNDSEKTAEVLKNGWYTTGDIAQIDEDGFIKITGRLSRISKIGGEMVPHILVEEEIEKILSQSTQAASETSNQNNIPNQEESALIRIAVSAIPDDKKGERLIILHKNLPISPEEICKSLHKVGLPNLWIPSHHDFYEVASIPLLGTGKLDLQGVKDLTKQVTNS